MSQIMSPGWYSTGALLCLSYWAFMIAFALSNLALASSLTLSILLTKSADDSLVAWVLMLVPQLGWYPMLT